MARVIGRLSAITINRLKHKGLYPDGGNLYLQISHSGAKSWVFRFMLHGKARTMGLGSIHAVSLAEAREKAAQCRNILLQGIDPIEVRKSEEAKMRLEAARSISFEECGKAYIEAHKAGWRNEKHIYQWNQTLSMYAYPVIGKLPVSAIDVSLVMKVLEPLWQKKIETASRLRGRIESILDWASSREYRSGDNPARWKGKLENLLPAPSKIQKTSHYAALPHDRVASFLMALKEQEGVAARALELTILTATRSGETLNATWSEMDFEKKLWVIPAERIKMGKEHRVPLSPSAMALLKRLHKVKTCNYVFAGRHDKPLSNMAMLSVLKRMERTDITVHGFRSSFRMWAAEMTDFPREVAELSLAHGVGNAVERAYMRSDLFDKRRKMMDMWARYCEKLEKKN